MNTPLAAQRLSRVLFSVAAVAALGACGGGSGSDEGSQSLSSGSSVNAPTPAPAPAPAPPSSGQAPAPNPNAQALYFSDCQTGASAGCVAGNNANAGTSASAPKQNLSGVNINSLAAGTQLLFNRGGAWAWSQTTLENLNATPSNPILFGDYGSGALPVLRTTSGNAFNLGGGWGNTTNDGGYTFRNLKLDGAGTASWGLWMVQNVRGVTLDGVEITGFNIAVHASNGTPYGITGLAIRNSRIVRNSDMGMLGSISGSLIENTLFEGNNFGGSSFSHAIYLSGGDNNTVRNNQFIANSAVNGVCSGGNLTAHGQVTNLLIEGNTIRQASATGGCYGISLTPGYNSVEWFRNTVVRGNTIINVGFVAIGAGAAPRILIENNKIVNTQSTYQVAIQVPTSVNAGEPTSVGDDLDTSPTVRNNTICYPNAASNSAGVSANVAGAVLSNNPITTGSAATTGACAL